MIDQLPGTLSDMTRAVRMSGSSWNFDGDPDILRFVKSPVSVKVIKASPRRARRRGGWCRSYVRSSGAVTVLAVAEEVAP